jgi:AraC family transcriptional regulator
VPASKYGHAFSGTDWQGPAMRKGEWDAQGRVEDVTAPADAVLLWAGEAHEVTLHGTTPGPRTTSHTFVRRSGMIDVMPAGTNLREISWRGGSATCVSLCFGDACLRDLFGDNIPRLDPAAGAHFGLENARVFALAERLQQQMVSGQPLGAAYVQGLSLTLASYVLASPGMARRPPLDARWTPPLNVEAIVAHVEDNLGRNLSLVELAQVAGYSPDHFTRLFKRAFLLSPYQYILRRRIARAKTLLRERRHSIVDVALAAGFSSQAHLSAMFKRSTGVTPGRYRKS